MAGLKDARKSQRRPKWEDAEFRTTYLRSLQSALASIPVIDPSRVDTENVQAVINSQCKQLKEAMHQAASGGLARVATEIADAGHTGGRMTVPFIETGRDCISTSGKAWAGLGAGKRTSATRTLDETIQKRVVIQAMQLYVVDTRTPAGFSSAISSVIFGA